MSIRIPNSCRECRYLYVFGVMCETNVYACSKHCGKHIANPANTFCPQASWMSDSCWFFGEANLYMDKMLDVIEEEKSLCQI